MPERRVNDQALLETARAIEQRRRHETLRTVIIVQCITLLIIILLGLGAWIELRNLLDGVEKQNDAQLIAIEDNRQAAMRAEAGQDRILISIGDRLVPKAEVRKLDRQTRLLRRTVRDLRRSVVALNRALARSGLSGG